MKTNISFNYLELKVLLIYRKKLQNTKTSCTKIFVQIKTVVDA